MKQCYFADYTIGKDAYDGIEKVCRPLGSRVLIVGGETALSKSIDKLKEAMTAFCIVDIVVYGKECTRKKAESLFDIYKDKNIDFVVGVGGGKALDTSKCLADLLGVRIVTVPTIVSTCAASSALAVMYTEEHAFDGFWYFDKPAYHVFVNTDILIEAPEEFFRAGIGDTLAKYYEVEFSARGREKTFNDEMAISISRMCNVPLLQWGAEAFEDCKRENITEKFEAVSLIILVSTGMVSMLVNHDFNGGVAHAIFYGLTNIEGFEEKFRHGDVVGYATAVQLMLDNKEEEAKKIGKLLESLGVEATLSDRGIEVSFEYLKPVLTSALNDPDMEVIPYKITEEMIFDAIVKMENEFGGKA